MSTHAARFHWCWSCLAVCLGCWSPLAASVAHAEQALPSGGLVSVLSRLQLQETQVESVRVRFEYYRRAIVPQEESLVPAEPFGGPRAGPESLHAWMDYARKGDKAAYREELANPDAPALRTRTSSMSMAFNGRCNARLYILAGGGPPIAMRTHSEKRDRDLSVYVPMIPAALWSRPLATLAEMGWRRDTMELAESPHRFRGQSCLRIIMRKERKATANLVGYVDLAPAGEFLLPLVLSAHQSGMPSSEMELLYADPLPAGAELPPTPIGWTFAYFGDRQPDDDSLLQATVTKFEVNPDIPDEEFEIDFPVGARVTEREGREERRSVVTEEGETPIAKAGGE